MKTQIRDQILNCRGIIWRGFTCLGSMLAVGGDFGADITCTVTFTVRMGIKLESWPRHGQ